MAELTSLRNIGNKIEKKLKTVGIATAEELRSVGSKKAFVRLKAHDPNVCATYLILWREQFLILNTISYRKVLSKS